MLAHPGGSVFPASCGCCAPLPSLQLLRCSYPLSAYAPSLHWSLGPLPAGEKGEGWCHACPLLESSPAPSLLAVPNPRAETSQGWEFPRNPRSCCWGAGFESQPGKNLRRDILMTGKGAQKGKWLDRGHTAGPRPRICWSLGQDCPYGLLSHSECGAPRAVPGSIR